MASFEEIVDQLEIDSARMHNIVNGSATEQITVEDGSLIPSIRKAMVDNLYFKTPPLPWNVGSKATVFNQLYAYTATDGSITWWYAPSATASRPVTLPENPFNVSAWSLYFDYNYLSGIYAPINNAILKGIPQAPTANINVNSDQIATTAYVHNIITNGNLSSTFENITVSKLTKTDQLEVTGVSSFGGNIDAKSSEAIFNTIQLHDTTGKLYFEYKDPNNPTWIPTVILPYEIRTNKFYASEVETPNANITTLQNTTLNSNKINVTDLNITGTVTGLNIEISVDGMTINPESVTTNSLLVNGRAEITDKLTVKDLEVTDTTTVKDLNITGTVTGFNFSVDGKDIRPNSVYTTTNAIIGQNLSVLEGDSTFKDVYVYGSITPLIPDIDTGEDDDGEEEEDTGLEVAEYLEVKAGLKTDGTIDTIGLDSFIQEQGVRVYSPNNKPSPEDIGTYTSTEIDQKITESGGFVDAPSDGKTYGRKDATWVEVTGGGSGDGTVKSVDGVSPDVNGNVDLNAGITNGNQNWSGDNTYSRLTTFNGGLTSATTINTQTSYNLGGFAVIQRLQEASTYLTGLGIVTRQTKILSNINPTVQIGASVANTYTIYHEGNKQPITIDDIPSILDKSITFPQGIIIDGTQTDPNVNSGLELKTILNTSKIILKDAVVEDNTEAALHIEVNDQDYSFDILGNFTVPNLVSAYDFTVRSDIRDKSDIKKIENALDIINKWSGNTYNIAGVNSSGLIAQEVLKTSPELIYKNINDEGEERLNIKPYGVQAYLVEALKELNKKYNDLENKYNELYKLLKNK